jgi:hypothetical protein
MESIYPLKPWSWEDSAGRIELGYEQGAMASVRRFSDGRHFRLRRGNGQIHSESSRRDGRKGDCR